MPSMRAMGPACCCCPDFYVFTAGTGSPPTQGYRKLYNSGEYPDNDVKIHEEGYTIPNTSGLVAMDYRHKRLFCYNGSTPNWILQEYDTDVKNRRDIISFTRLGNVIGIATDYQHQRLYYTKWVTINNPPVQGDTVSQEIRRVDYDGTNDTLLHTETFVLDATAGLWGVNKLVWEPNYNQLYYVFSKNVAANKPGPDTNMYAYIKRMSADDGSGLTTLYSLEDTVNTNGDWNITGFGVSPMLDKTLWLERHSYTNLVTLKVADLDCAGDAGIYSTSTTTLNCKPNEKEGKIYFEDSTTPSGVATRTIHKIDYDGSNMTAILDDRQDGWDRPGGASSYRSGQALRAIYGCRKELTGSAYEGSGYSGG